MQFCCIRGCQHPVVLQKENLPTPRLDFALDGIADKRASYSDHRLVSTGQPIMRRR